MAASIRVLNITPGSDGDGRKWPKHTYVRNDAYFLERIATDKWIKDLPGGPQPGVVYRLDKLPNGYAGFEKARPDSKHVDRYIYGHPQGQFRSLNEFYPHFKHLMDFGGPVGCECKNCKGENSKKKPSGPRLSGSGNESDGKRLVRQSQYFAEPSRSAQESEAAGESDGFQGQLISPFRRPVGRPSKQLSDAEQAKKARSIDAEGTQDVYESMIANLKAAERGIVVDFPIEERMSSDWRVGNSLSRALLQEWKELPRYVHRCGELVLYVRALKDGETIAWDKNSQTFRRVDNVSKKLLERPEWEVGVVTQMPTEALSTQDLITDEHNEQSVTNSGFRIEQLLEPGAVPKPYANHKYVSAHAIRPLSLLKECVNGLSEAEWHPTIKYALQVACSFSVVSRYRFRGIWPDATVFSRGVYIGPELILVGDTVRLLPRKREQSGNAVTDIMVVTAIRLRFVNLDLEEDDESPMPLGLPYQTCLHLSGCVYTLDPARSFDGVGKVPIDPDSDILPSGLREYGQWYHYSDPEKPDARVELPYTRVLGRCFEGSAIKAWFTTNPDTAPPSSFQAVNTRPAIIEAGNSEISRGLQVIQEARSYSQKHDKRIKSQEGKTWFWADTRIEQLDLHEVNGRYVGEKHALRTPAQMAKWRHTLKQLDGKKGGLEEYHAARKERQQQEQARSKDAFGIMAAPPPADLETDQVEDDEESMEIDENQVEHGGDVSGIESDDDHEMQLESTPRKIEAISLLSDDSEDEDELTRNQLVGELARNMRKGQADPRLR